MYLALWVTRLVYASSESPEPITPAGDDVGSSLDFLTQTLGPILGTGLVGALFLMVLFRVKIMPTYVYDKAEQDWDKERERLVTERTEERDRFTAEIADLKLGLKDANKVYTEQVIPTLTRVLDAERELVDLRRDEAAERRRRGGEP